MDELTDQYLNPLVGLNYSVVEDIWIRNQAKPKSQYVHEFLHLRLKLGAGPSLVGDETVRLCNEDGVLGMVFI